MGTDWQVLALSGVTLHVLGGLGGDLRGEMGANWSPRGRQEDPKRSLEKPT